MSQYNFHSQCVLYNSLGYDLTITSMYGKSGLRLTKRYSYPLQLHGVTCFQICHVENLDKNLGYLAQVTEFLYKNIEAQENEGIRKTT